MGRETIAITVTVISKTVITITISSTSTLTKKIPGNITIAGNKITHKTTIIIRKTTILETIIPITSRMKAKISIIRGTIILKKIKDRVMSFRKRI